MVPRVRSPDGVELKFNPWHDPANGRFTFAHTGDYHPRGSRSSDRADAPKTTSPEDARRILRPKAYARELAANKPLPPAPEPVWVDENAAMKDRARRYNDSAPGARSDPVTQRRQAPALYRTLEDGSKRPVRFDGYQDGVFIDRKINIVFKSDAKARAVIQSQVLREKKRGWTVGGTQWKGEKGSFTAIQNAGYRQHWSKGGARMKMLRILALTIADMAVLLESYSEPDIDQDVSVKASESLIYNLRELDEEEMAQLCSMIREVAAEYEGEARGFVLSIPEVYNLEPHPDDLVDDGDGDTPATPDR